MNDVLLAIIFGAVQGLTEFLPVSSSGHLVLLHSIADLQLENDLAFDVALHVGTLAAVVTYFFKDILKLASGWFRSFSGRIDADGRLSWWLVLATIPGAVFGYIASQSLEDAVRSPITVSIVLMVGGVALWVIDKMAKQSKDVSQLGWKSAILIGLGQSLALIPGVSRSGATIMIARLVGLTRPAAARFSFLLSVPIIAGAGLKQMIDVRGSEFDPTIIFTGMIAAAIVGYFVIGL
jgi:undecaprenyl-diphosphatase